MRFFLRLKLLWNNISHYFVLESQTRYFFTPPPLPLHPTFYHSRYKSRGRTQKFSKLDSKSLKTFKLQMDKHYSFCNIAKSGKCSNMEQRVWVLEGKIWTSLKHILATNKILFVSLLNFSKIAISSKCTNLRFET